MKSALELPEVNEYFKLTTNGEETLFAINKVKELESSIALKPKLERRELGLSDVKNIVLNFRKNKK